MECHVCMEAFTAIERRPKSLPCGHTFCLRCLQRLKTRRCPVDSKVFQSEAHALADNFYLLQLINNPADNAAPRFWCRTCKKHATELCVDEHVVCSLQKARGEDAGPLLEALQRGEAGLDKLGETLDAAADGVDVQACRRQLQQEKAGLAAARGRLQDAMGADAGVWEEAKQAALQGGLSRSAAQLVADLADPSVTCTVTLLRGAAGSVAWRGDARPAEEAAARLLLCRLMCAGGLQQQDQLEGEQLEAEQRPVAPRWQERTNEGDCEMTVEEMAALMEKGSRVARGRDWMQGWTEDGTPPGPGTVTEKGDGRVGVKWDCDGGMLWYHMGLNGEYQLRLLAPPPLKPCFKTPNKTVDASTWGSNPDRNTLVAQIAEAAQVRSLVGLRCSGISPWSQKVLEQMVPHLVGLQMVSPLPRHLAVAQAMPHLQALSLTGVTGETLRQVGQMASLRRLELHCPLDAPLPVLTLPAMGLRWLRCGVYPLAAALALVRANADSLEELQLVAASTEPYGCPDLAVELRRCGLKKLQRLVLLRHTVYGAPCRHDKASCRVQKDPLWDMFAESDIFLNVLCSVCDYSKCMTLC